MRVSCSYQVCIGTLRSPTPPTLEQNCPSRRKPNSASGWWDRVVVWWGLPQITPWEAGGLSTVRGPKRSWTQNRHWETILTHWVWLHVEKKEVCFSALQCEHSQNWWDAFKGCWVEEHRPEVLCAVLVREPLWLEARMDDQALFEGIVVFSDEDGPGREAFI